MKFYRSSDTRLKSDFYNVNGEEICCLVEKTQGGMLVTEFNRRGIVERQAHLKPEDSDYKSMYESMEIADSGEYRLIAVDARCAACGGEISRELDLVHPSVINAVPVVPMYVCRKCGKRHYSMTESYLRDLVKSKKELFEERDLKELSEDEGAFLGTLQEYIIRIFASKKISRIR